MGVSKALIFSINVLILSVAILPFLNLPVNAVTIKPLDINPPEAPQSGDVFGAIVYIGQLLAYFFSVPANFFISIINHLSLFSATVSQLDAWIGFPIFTTFYTILTVAIAVFIVRTIAFGGD